MRMIIAVLTLRTCRRMIVVMVTQIMSAVTITMIGCRIICLYVHNMILKVTSTATAKMLNIFPRKGCIAEVIMMIMVVLVMRVVMIDVIMVVKIKKATLR